MLTCFVHQILAAKARKRTDGRSALPAPPNVPPVRPLRCPLDGIRGISKGNCGGWCTMLFSLAGAARLAFASARSFSGL